MKESDKRKKLVAALKRTGLYHEACEVGLAINNMLWGFVDARDDIKTLEKQLMDKKMAKVTKQMKTAVRDVKAKKPAAAVKALKGAEKKNVKLTKIDREVRDPMIKKCKASMKMGKKK